MGGRIVLSGDRKRAAVLARAWSAAAGDGRFLTHGFHAYPARLHPLVARQLVLDLSAAGERVLDPFAGSGTVLIEAFAADRRAVGTDVNPVAVRLAHLKTRRTSGAARRDLEQRAASISGRVAASGRSFDHARADRQWLQWFAPHVLRELAALGAEVAAAEPPPLRAALEMILSSLLVKLSRRAGDTSDERRPKQLAQGMATRLFRDRATELALGLRELAAAAPPEAPEPLVLRADARQLPLRANSVDLVVTSPPYLGTYDYAEFQELRADLLDFDPRRVAYREIGRRRGRDEPSDRVADFEHDLCRALKQVRRVLRKGRFAAVVIGDSRVDRERVAGDRVLAAAARAADLDVVAGAAQERPILDAGAAQAFGREGRFEHIVLLRRHGGDAADPPARDQ